jgi:hypothetical protein
VFHRGRVRPDAAKVNLVALGLAFWVAVPLIQTIQALAA